LGPEREAFFDRYKFDIAPATDDRPFFFQFLKWRTLPELLRLKDQGGLPLLEWGYPVLIATLLQALLASVVLILLPFWIARGRVCDGHAVSAGPRAPGPRLAGAHSLGLGSQRLRLGGRGRPRHAAGDPSGVQRGSPARGAALCAGGRRASVLALIGRVPSNRL